MSFAKTIYALINNYLTYLGYAPKQIYYGLNVSIDNIIQNIENL